MPSHHSCTYIMIHTYIIRSISFWLFHHQHPECLVECSGGLLRLGCQSRLTPRSLRHDAFNQSDGRSRRGPIRQPAHQEPACQATGLLSNADYGIQDRPDPFPPAPSRYALDTSTQRSYELDRQKHMTRIKGIVLVFLSTVKGCYFLPPVSRCGVCWQTRNLEEQPLITCRSQTGAYRLRISYSRHIYLPIPHSPKAKNKSWGIKFGNYLKLTMPNAKALRRTGAYKPVAIASLLSVPRIARGGVLPFQNRVIYPNSHIRCNWAEM